MIHENLLPIKPEYRKGSIVNLMQSIIEAFNPNEEFEDGAYGPLEIFPKSRSEKANRVAFLVIDGLGQDLYNSLENQKSLDHWHQGTMTSVYPPTTASAISTFLTGTAPKQHAITGWYMYLREISEVATILPFISREKSHDLRKYNLDPLTLTNSKNLIQRLGVKSAILQPAEISDSAFSQSMTRGAYRNPYRSFEELSSFLGEFIAGNTDLDYLYGYIPTIDSTAHRFGPYSLEVIKEYEKVADVVSKACALAENSDTLLLVTADHGFIQNPPEKRIYLKDHPQLKRMLSLPLCGEPRTAYAYVKEREKQDFVAYVNANLSEAIQIEESVKFASTNWLGTGTPNELLKERLGDFILLMKENYAIYDPLPKETTPSLLGVHGGRSSSEINVPLFVAGP